MSSQRLQLRVQQRQVVRPYVLPRPTDRRTRDESDKVRLRVSAMSKQVRKLEKLRNASLAITSGKLSSIDFSTFLTSFLDSRETDEGKKASKSNQRWFTFKYLRLFIFEWIFSARKKSMNGGSFGQLVYFIIKESFNKKFSKIFIHFRLTSTCWPAQFVKPTRQSFPQDLKFIW